MPNSGIAKLPEELIRNLHPISALAGEGWRAVLPICSLESYVRGADPLDRKDWSGHILYLVRGELRVDAHAGGMDVLVGGKGRALVPFHAPGTKPLRCKAITDVDVLAVEAEPFDILVTWDQCAEPAEAQDRLHATDWRQMSGMFAVRNLTQGAFSALPPAHIGPLLDRFERVSVAKGQIVLRQGDPGDYYYLIDRGRARVTRQVGGATIDLADLGEGDAFGEEALVADTPRNATVAMRTAGVLLRLAKSDFVTLLREPLLQTVDYDQAKRRIAGGATWVDVRFPAEFLEDGLPGAINVPVNEIRKASTLLSSEKEYIIYCQTGRRSSAATFLLAQRGIRAWLLQGGLRGVN